ncbi:MAG: hypothetical protein C5B50_28735 [Verrucomicrobia bacterium]|nr:MAG: hypothetical protein C5B50_28735 [Verrucomicrobiota bacterium]
MHPATSIGKEGSSIQHPASAAIASRFLPSPFAHLLRRRRAKAFQVPHFTFHVSRCGSILHLLSALFLFALFPFRASAYSLLTHEEIVDLLWHDDIQPLLLKRFPSASRDDLLRAHAYSYGGCLIYDMGYMPFGNRFFTDLLHYVRTGDFVVNLIHESQNLNEYAFALGSLSHYAADIAGHPSVNRAVALSFPKLQARYGPEVTYEECTKAHIRTEFGFDLVQVAKHRYTSDQYHDFIGFAVSKPLLERTFFQTYGLTLRSVLENEELAIGTLRRAVSKVIPEITRAAIEWKKPDIAQLHETPNAEHRLFRYYLSRAEYQREWGREYRHPTIPHRILTFCLRCIPKIGPFGALAFNIPNTQTEDLYLKSINKTVENYRGLLLEVGRGNLRAPNHDLDTGMRTSPGEYRLCDKTFAQLVHELYLQTTSPEHRAHHRARPPHHIFAEDGSSTSPLASPKNADSSWRASYRLPPPARSHPQFQIESDIRSAILAYYSSGAVPVRTCSERRRWRQTQFELGLLKASQPLL